MLLTNLLTTLPGLLRAASACDPDHSLAGLVLGCSGGWSIAWGVHQRARLRDERARRKSDRDRGTTRSP